MDDLDHRLLGALMRDGRATYADLADLVGLSVSATKRRVDRLVQDGVIAGFTAIVDRRALGWALEALVHVFTSGTVPAARMRRQLESVPEIVEAFTIAGAADTVVRVVATDSEHLERVITRLRGLTHVQRTDTALVLTRLVSRPTTTEVAG